MKGINFAEGKFESDVSSKWNLDKKKSAGVTRECLHPELKAKAASSLLFKLCVFALVLNYTRTLLNIYTI